MEKQINKFIESGFAYAYHYKPNATLEDALTFKFVATCETAAKSVAERMLFSGEKEIKIWNLKESLLHLSKENI